MHFNFRTVAILMAGLVLVTACNRIPDHARYIPADAVFVAGVNTGQLGKKIAWSAITGSALFGRLKERSSRASSADAIRQLDQAGIRFGSTAYMYLKQDRRFDADMRMTLLVPLEDAAQLEAYVRKVFPGIAVRERQGYKEILVEDEAVAGWNDRLLIVMNVIKQQSPGGPDTMTMTDSMAPVVMTAAPVDTLQTAAELAGAFAITKQQALTGNTRFIRLEQEDHDISIWINYDAVMSRATGGSVAGMAAMGMAGSLWQGTVITAGIDFNKGAVNGVMKYYVSDALKEVYRAFGNDKTDREMLDRVPKQQLGLLAGWHLSTKGMKQLLDKTGLSGIAALGLMESGLTVDNVFQAFSGDMVMAVNDFRLLKAPADLPAGDDPDAGGSYEPGMSFTYALRIGRQDDFNRLVQYAVTKGVFHPAGEHTYVTGSVADPSSVMITNDVYAVISNKKELALDWLQGKYKREQLPAAARRAVYGHPMGLFLDVQQMSSGLQAGTGDANIATAAQAAQLLSHVSINSEPFRGDAYVSRMEIAFRDKNENSLLQLLDFAIRMDALAAN